jgi:hypothetical protein
MHAKLGSKAIAALATLVTLGAFLARLLRGCTYRGQVKPGGVGGTLHGDPLGASTGEQTTGPNVDDRRWSV